MSIIKSKIKMEFKEKNLGYTIAILSIFTAFIMITEWKKYEAKVITASKKPVTDSLNYDATVSFETAEKIAKSMIKQGDRRSIFIGSMFLAYIKAKTNREIRNCVFIEKNRHVRYDFLVFLNL